MSFVIKKKAKLTVIFTFVISLLWTPCSIATFGAVLEYQTDNTGPTACIHHDTLNQADDAAQVQKPDQDASSELCSLQCSASFISPFDIPENTTPVLQVSLPSKDSNFYQITQPLNYRPPKRFTI